MRRALAALVIGALLFAAALATPSSGDEPPVDDCDRLAANPYDLEKRDSGIPWKQLDPATAIPACRAALDRYPAHPGFQFQYGRALHKAGRDAEAVTWYRVAAEQGYAAAQRNLGRMYVGGKGVPQDYDEAVNLFRMAAARGSAVAQANLGIMYADGQGVARDDGEAVKWYRLAAEQGLAPAQNNLGLMYAEGRGVPQDYGQAIDWFRKAAAQDHARAQVNLAVLYMTGRGVAWDPFEAVMWFLEALTNWEL